jgi:lipopolysaccharide/colanic/teichoic acid biosynthesis glycosyltransferase
MNIEASGSGNREIMTGTSRDTEMAGGDETIYLSNGARPAETLEVGAVAVDGQNTSLNESEGDFALLRGLYWHFKRPLGLLIGLLGAVACIPALAVIALTLARQGRPVFIRRTRLGQFGRPFTSYYFRTMTPDSLRTLDAITGQPTFKTDSFGRFLLRTKFDHLPLMLNVLRGDMNLVGPRPLSQEELIGAGRSARFSLSVRPGVTGLWWLHNENDLRRRLALDRSYIDRASLWLDTKIVVRTLLMIHFG